MKKQGARVKRSKRDASKESSLPLSEEEQNLFSTSKDDILTLKDELVAVAKSTMTVRPSTYTRLPKSVRSSQSLSLPYGLKFKESEAIPVPRNLDEASTSISQLKEKDPDLLQGYSLDLEVLLGNKRAMSKPEAETQEGDAALQTPNKSANSSIEDSLRVGVGETKSEGLSAARTGEEEVEAGTGAMEAEPVPVAYDSDRDGPPRFGGGTTGKPLSLATTSVGPLDATVPRGMVTEDAAAAACRSDELKRKKRAELGSAEMDDIQEGEAETVHTKLLGLPGALGITTTETERYFGDQSRVNFFDRYHYVKSQRQHLLSKEDGGTKGLVFQSQGSVFGGGVTSSDVPFSPVRPDGQGVDLALMTSMAGGVRSGTEDAVHAGIYRDTHKRGASRNGQGGLFSASTTRGPVALAQSASTAAGVATTGRHSGRGTPRLAPLSVTPNTFTAHQSPLVQDSRGDNPLKELKINTGVEMAELFGASLPPSRRGSIDGKSVSGDTTASAKEALAMQRMHDENDRKQKEEYFLRIAKMKEEMRLSALEELTYQEETAMEMEAIALQGHLLEKAEMERRAADERRLRKEEAMMKGEAATEAEDEGEADQFDLTKEAINDSGAFLAPMSPRTRYIDGCLREKITPKASLMTRRGMSKKLDLSHHGIGDKMCRILSECIVDMPYLQSLIISDNNLTDESLGPLVRALVKMPSLLEVDISNNIVGDTASNTLSDYLGSPSCPIIKLVMQSADVDDFECARFVLAIQNNPGTKLQELDLTRNLLGAAEELNTVMPELVTAGEAFAELLESGTCTIKKLEVAWNMIRGESAVTMADSLGVNQSLTYLDLSYNAMGKDGGQRVGNALIENKSIIHLDLSSNNIEATGCFCICVGLIENKTIRRVLLDGNPIGALGARAIMQVPLMAGRRMKLTAANCNISITDASLQEKFNFDNLLKTYKLQMDDPFDRAQAFMLTYCIACHHTYLFKEVRLDNRVLDLVAFLNPDRAQFFTPGFRATEQSLLAVIEAASDVRVAVSLFKSIDMDGSGELDRDEFRLLMSKIGIELDNDRLEDIFDTYDTDQGGTIGTDEFLVFLRRQRMDAEKRLLDMTQTPAYCLKIDYPYNQSLEEEDTRERKRRFREQREARKNEGEEQAKRNKENKIKDEIAPKPRKRWIIPRAGVLEFDVEDGFKRKNIYRTVTGADRASIEDVAEGTTDSVAMTSFGVMGVKMRLDEAVALYNVMTMESRNKSKVLSKILPQLGNPSDARQLVVKVLKNDRMEMLNLRSALGVAIRPLLGNMNGYYELDLSVALDRLCLMRLLEQSATRNNILRRRKRNPIGGRPLDISQKKNNNSCFRNEIYNGKPTVIDTTFATPLPRMGTLCFDFSGGHLPNHDDMMCTDHRVVKILTTLYLLSCRPNVMDMAIAKLEGMKKDTAKCMRGDGLTIYEADWSRACKIGDLMNAFYDNLVDRTAEMLEVSEEEEISVNVLAKQEEMMQVDDELVSSSMVGHHFNLARDTNHAPGSLNRKQERARVRRQNAASAGPSLPTIGSSDSLDGSHFEEGSLVLSTTGASVAGDLSVASIGGTVSGEDSSIIYDLAKLEALEKAEATDDDLSRMDENEDDKQLLLLITHMETHGLPVGDGSYRELKGRSEAENDGGGDDASRMKPFEIVSASQERAGDTSPSADAEKSEGGAPDIEPVWSFPFVRLILGDQKAVTNYFVSLPEPPPHEHEEKFLNHHHKHAVGHHGRKKKANKGTGKAKSKGNDTKGDENASHPEDEGGEEEHDDIPHFPLHYGSPAFVCVTDNEAYRVETEGMRRMTERQRLLREEVEKKQLKHTKHDKHTKHGKHTKHERDKSKENRVEPHNPEELKVPKVSVHDYDSEDDDESHTKVHRLHPGDPGYDSDANMKAEEESISKLHAEGPQHQKVITRPENRPIAINFDPGPRGTTILILQMVNTTLALPEHRLSGAPGSSDEASVATGDNNSQITGGSSIESSQESLLSSQVVTKAVETGELKMENIYHPEAVEEGDPEPLAKLTVDVGEHMDALLNGQEVHLDWKAVTLLNSAKDWVHDRAERGVEQAHLHDPSPPAFLSKFYNASAEVISTEKEVFWEEKKLLKGWGARLSMRMMTKKQYREYEADLDQRAREREDVIAYASLSEEEKMRLESEKKRMEEESGLGKVKASKLTLLGNTGENDEDEDPEARDLREAELAEGHKDGHGIDTRHKADLWATRYKCTLLHDAISKRAKSVRILEALDESFSKLWIYCRHLALILECFEHMGRIHRTAYFGSYRSDLVCQLYERLVDVNNFELVLRVLEPFEVAAVLCRVGWLNFYNPMKPEGAIQLNLRRYEERMIAKFLCTLATIEPGNNWTQYQFRWKQDGDCVPGWELTEGWVKQDGQDNGIATRGCLTLYYYSGDGQKLQGCRPNINFRKALFQMTFLSEEDIRPEEQFSTILKDADREKYYEKGKKYCMANSGLFGNYIMVDKQVYPHVVQPARGGEDGEEEEEGEEG